MESWLTGSPLPGMVLWFVLYTSDYYLTLATARGYKELGVFLYEKSFELTPQFQKDIEAQSRISKLHIAFLISYTIFILVFWHLSNRFTDRTWMYSLLIGALILLEVVVHQRHLRNWYQIRILRREGGIRGQVTFSQRFSYLNSSFDFYVHAILFGLFSLLTFSPFFLGGMLICIVNGVRQGIYANRVSSPSKADSHHADSASG